MRRSGDLLCLKSLEVVVTEINLIFDGGYTLGFLFLLFVLKLLATSLCIGFGLFGGVFSPAAMIGAAAGGFLGKFLTSIGVVTVPQLLPVAGFAAVTAQLLAPQSQLFWWCLN